MRKLKTEELDNEKFKKCVKPILNIQVLLTNIWSVICLLDWVFSGFLVWFFGLVCLVRFWVFWFFEHMKPKPHQRYRVLRFFGFSVSRCCGFSVFFSVWTGSDWLKNHTVCSPSRAALKFQKMKDQMFGWKMEGRMQEIRRLKDQSNIFFLATLNFLITLWSVNLLKPLVTMSVGGSLATIGGAIF